MRIPGAMLMLAIAAMHPAVADEHKRLAPPGWEDAITDYGYTPVLVAGNTLVISGIPVANGKTFEEKVQNFFKALDAHLEVAGFARADIIEIQSFHLANSSAELRRSFEQYLPYHQAYFKDAGYPAWTAVGVTALFSPSAVMEIRVMAKKRKSHDE